MACLPEETGQRQEGDKLLRLLRGPSLRSYGKATTDELSGA
jgi:hypothetical protein